ncbi:hypothetical protein V6N11_061688 [Hibiscus sabdariffa]|uniref:Uncharacterized protein n=2 Tax=Hibiscus sabdariffa TaxID=183260 RepID=A0ABR2CY11_9ROSI
MEGLSFIVGVIGNVISVLVFLCPVPGAYLVATVNGFGILAEAVYVVLFLIYAPRKMRVKTGILVGILDVGFLGAAVLVTRLALEGETRIDAIGFMCAGPSSCMAPL